MRKDTKKIAICGVIGALALAIMLMGGILPLATFLAPAIAGILIMPVAIEYGNKSGVLLYISISILSVLITADKEMALIFIFFFGHYPLLKTVIERVHSKIFKIALKLLVFNASVCSMYAILIFLFPLGAITSELSGGMIFMLGLLILGNIAFVIYDLAVARIIWIYCATWRDKLMKMI